MTNIMNRICVIIVTYNGMKWINRCLSDLGKSTLPTDTIVVDNCSTDSTCKFIESNYPDIKIFKMVNNLGFGQANNFGIKYALDKGYDWIYLLNQDAYVYPDMFEKLLFTIEKSNDPTIGILSPLQLHPNGKWLEAHFEAYVRKSISLDKMKNLKVCPVDGVQAAGWLIPRKTFETIGGFNPMFFHYGEDENFFQRARYHRLKTVVVPSAKMIHDHIDYGKRKLESTDRIFRMLKSQSFLNINKSVFNIAWDCLVWFCRGCYHSIKYLSLQHINDSLMAIIRNVAQSNEYNENRRLTKKPGQLWL